MDGEQQFFFLYSESVADWRRRQGMKAILSRLEWFTVSGSSDCYSRDPLHVGRSCRRSWRNGRAPAGKAGVDDGWSRHRRSCVVVVLPVFVSLSLIIALWPVYCPIESRVIEVIVTPKPRCRRRLSTAVFIHFYIYIFIHQNGITQRERNTNIQTKSSINTHYVHSQSIIQYWQNVLTEFSYLLINLWHLSLTVKLGSTQRKYPWHSLISSTFELLNNFMHIRLYVKSRECRSLLLSWHDSRPYKTMGIHFLAISSKITSSEAKFRILLKMPLTAR